MLGLRLGRGHASEGQEGDGDKDEPYPLHDPA
jgi:hypothetical protein